jgi:hypothetical protein
MAQGCASAARSHIDGKSSSARANFSEFFEHEICDGEDCDRDCGGDDAGGMRGHSRPSRSGSRRGVTATIQVGVDNKESVQRSLGRPTFTGTFDENDWYYVLATPRPSPSELRGSRTRRCFESASTRPGTSFRSQTGPELIARVNPVNDKTPTLGRKRTLFEDIFGNIGAVGAPMPDQQ